MSEIPSETELCGTKLGGYTVDSFLKAEGTCRWFEGHTDNGDKAILYLYETIDDRDAARSHVYGFTTSALSGFNFGVERLQFRSGVFDFELPIDPSLFLI